MSRPAIRTDSGVSTPTTACGNGAVGGFACEALVGPSSPLLLLPPVPAVLEPPVPPLRRLARLLANHPRAVAVSGGGVGGGGTAATVAGAGGKSMTTGRKRMPLRFMILLAAAMSVLACGGYDAEGERAGGAGRGARLMLVLSF